MILQWCYFHCLGRALENEERGKILYHTTFFMGADNLICYWTVHIVSAKFRKIGPNPTLKIMNIKNIEIARQTLSLVALMFILI